MPQYGRALIERRQSLGFRAASDLARVAKEMTATLADPQFSSFTQQTLSRLEADDTGRFIVNARPAILRSLSCVLGWRASQFQRHVGVGISNVSMVRARDGRLLPIPDSIQIVRFVSNMHVTEAEMWLQAAQYAQDRGAKPIERVDLLELDADYAEAVVTLRDGMSFLLTGTYDDTETDPGHIPFTPAAVSDELRQASANYSAIDPLIADPEILDRLAGAASTMGNGPKTTVEWILFFNALRPWLGEP